MAEHDFINYPELTNQQIEELRFESPHKQITEDFYAVVVKVIDGDTVTLRTDFRDFDFPLRFLGIDAPEMNEGGEVARDWLSNRILNATVQIRIETSNRVDKYGRLLGRIFHMGSDVGDDEVRLGLAVPFGSRREGELPDINEILDVRQWL